MPAARIRANRSSRNGISYHDALDEILDGTFGLFDLLLCTRNDAPPVAWTVTLALDKLQLAASLALNLFNHLAAFADHHAHR